MTGIALGMIEAATGYAAQKRRCQGQAALRREKWSSAKILQIRKRPPATTWMRHQAPKTSHNF